MHVEVFSRGERFFALDFCLIWFRLGDSLVRPLGVDVSARVPLTPIDSDDDSHRQGNPGRSFLGFWSPPNPLNQSRFPNFLRGEAFTPKQSQGDCESMAQFNLCE
jgi:hypothetical protein